MLTPGFIAAVEKQLAFRFSHKHLGKANILKEEEPTTVLLSNKVLIHNLIAKRLVNKSFPRFVEKKAVLALYHIVSLVL